MPAHTHRTCPNCHTTFTPSRINHTYCTPRCSAAARGRRWRRTPRGQRRNAIAQARSYGPHARPSVTPETMQAWEDSSQHCAICGDLIDPAAEGEQELSIEYDLPPSKGGRDDLDNIIFTHLICGAAKGARTVIEYEDWLDDPNDNRRFVS